MRTSSVWAGVACAGGLLWPAGADGLRAQGMTAPATTSVTAPAPAEGPTPEQLAELHALAESLWNDYAPETVKAEYELIGRDELIALFARLETAGQQEDLAKFADYAPETRAAIAAMRALPDYADYADWLREQLEDMEAAKEATVPPKPPTTPEQPAPPEVKPTGIPLYELWLARVEKRARPPRADEFLPVVTAAFAAEGVPAELAWLAEVESMFNPRARSPVGAKGLFQLMPVTARALGLSLLPFDQRTNPEASARAAAAYLKKLHARFGDWPLALAAYNAGEGRVARTLKAQGAKDFAGIAEHLPSETKLYVPKVLATVQVRAGVTPAELAAPGGG